ncbi:MAG TPA: hypothetical protein DIU15_19240 [Deltaproteobacteria bacterium]|nr:hypothetical protein [Deltaproteobacteria bacterium]HCP48182.1 hypothetical protein [Deltaproteobacteria bacterium]
MDRFGGSVVQRRGLEGVVWVLSPTSNFEATVGFFDELKGLVLEDSGTPTQDLQFSRYAMFRTLNGVVLEVVEPIAEKADLFTHPVVSISVRDLPATRTRLDDQGVDFITDIIGTDSEASWTYFRSPCGTLYQLSEDSSVEQPEPVLVGSPGIERIVVPCRSLDETVEFFERALGFAVQVGEVGGEFSHFSRSAQVPMKNGFVLQLVEPRPVARNLYGGPVVALTIEDLPSEIARLEERGIPLEVGNDTVGGHPDWCCFQVPGGTVFRIQGSLATRSEQQAE